MYGTLARISIKQENVEKLRALFDDQDARTVSGYVASHVLIPDERRGEVWLAVFFEDKDSYTRNADDPAQHQDYLKMRALLEDDPEWIDGTWETTSPVRSE